MLGERTEGKASTVEVATLTDVAVELRAKSSTRAAGVIADEFAAGDAAVAIMDKLPEFEVVQPGIRLGPGTHSREPVELPFPDEVVTEGLDVVAGASVTGGSSGGIVGSPLVLLLFPELPDVDVDIAAVDDTVVASGGKVATISPLPKERL